MINHNSNLLHIFEEGVILWDIINIICSLLILVYLFIGFIKSKKIYKITVIVVLLINIYLHTPLESDIGKTNEIILTVITIILTITTIYSMIRARKQNKNS